MGSRPRPGQHSTVDESATGAADDGNTNTTSSRRITVTNMTSDTIKLMDVVGTRAFEGRPADGSTIAPGQTHSWEVTYQYGKNNTSYVRYWFYTPDGRYDGNFFVDLTVDSNGLSNPKVKSKCDSSGSSAGFQCSAGGDKVTVIDKPGAVKELDGSKPNQEAAGVLQMCDSGIGATCTFKATKEKICLGPARQVGS